MDKFNNMKVFCRIVELGTFAAVAREINVSAMMVSKYIAHLEKSLGVVLLNRTTRSLVVTEAGEFYYNKAKQLLDDLNVLEDSVSQLNHTVQGTLKITAPIDFGGIYMIPAIEAYQRLYPDVTILMSLDNQPTNLRQGLFDISILVTDTLDPGIVARKITRTELSIYASPDYLKKNPCPETVKDLSQHKCLHYINTPHGENWIFNQNGKIEKLKINWVFASNNGRALCQAASLGMGIVQAPKLSVIDYLEQKKLVEILTEYKIPSLLIYATYLQRRFYPAKLTTFIDFLISYFEQSNHYNE